MFRTRRFWLANRSGDTRALGSSPALLIVILAALLVASLGFALQPRLLLLLPPLAVVLLLGVAWPWLSTIAVQSALHFNTPRVYEGETISATLRLRQRLPWPCWGARLELIPGSSDGAAWWLPTLLPLVDRELACDLAVPKRGVYPAQPPRLVTGFPFGLLNATRRCRVDSRLVVWPRVFTVTAPPAWASADQAAGHVETRRVGAEGDTIGVRAYRRGDPMRWIHWPQTARHGRFVVREFQAASTPRLRVVLDCDRSVHVGRGTDASFEWAVRIAASLAVGWLDHGAEIELLAGNRHIKLAGGLAQRRALLDTLAEVQLDSHGPSPSPPAETPTVLISTDLGWARRPEPLCCASRGFALQVAGFGAVDAVVTSLPRGVIRIATPQAVPEVLRRSKRGLTDAA